MEVIIERSGRLRTRRASFQTEYVLHVVDAGFLADDPLGRTQSTSCENSAIARLVSQLHAFAKRGKHDRVIADDVTAAQSVNTHLRGSALAGDALPAMAQRVRVELPLLEDDFEQACRRAARCVFF